MSSPAAPPQSFVVPADGALQIALTNSENPDVYVRHPYAHARFTLPSAPKVNVVASSPFEIAATLANGPTLRRVRFS